MAGCNTDLDRLLATLRIKLPGVDDDALNLELFNTCDDFFRKTNTWREIIEVPLVEGVMDYPIVGPDNTVLVRVLEAVIKGGYVAPATGGVLAASQSGSRQVRLVGDELFEEGDALFYADGLVGTLPTNSFHYAIYYPNYLTIDAPPSQDVVGVPLKIVAAITLSSKSLSCNDGCGGWSVPEWMWERYFNEWLHGTLANCMSEGAKPYSNIKLATYHASEYRRGKSFARQEAQRGFIFDRPTWQYPRIGGWVR